MAKTKEDKKLQKSKDKVAKSGKKDEVKKVQATKPAKDAKSKSKPSKAPAKPVKPVDDSSDSDSDEELKVTKAKAAAAKQKDDSDSDSESSEDEKPKAAQIKPIKVAAPPSDSSDDSDDDDEPKSKPPAKSATSTKPPQKTTETSKTKKPAAEPVKKSAPKKAGDSDESSESESDEEPKPKAAAAVAAAKKADSDSDSSDSEDEDDKKKAKADSDSDSDGSDSDAEMEDGTSKLNGKRKAPDSSPNPTKKVKLANGDAAPATTPDEQTCSIFVGKLSWNVDNDWLASEFASCGEVVSAKVQMDRNTGKSRGFGYVHFSTPEAVEKAIETMQGKEIDGRPINVDKSQPPNPDQAREKRSKFFGDDKVSPPSSTLFVGNLSFNCNEDMVWEAFNDHGVKNVRLPTDRDTGNLKGFGYVEFESVDGAKKAFEAMKGQEIDGRTIRLDYSQPRDASGGGGGFRGGGGGGRGGFRGGDRGGRGGRGGGRGSDRGWGGRGGGRGGRGGGFRGGGNPRSGGFAPDAGGPRKKIVF